MSQVWLPDAALPGSDPWQVIHTCASASEVHCMGYRILINVIKNLPWSFFEHGAKLLLCCSASRQLRASRKTMTQSGWLTGWSTVCFIWWSSSLISSSSGFRCTGFLRYRFSVLYNNCSSWLFCPEKVYSHYPVSGGWVEWSAEAHLSA